MFQTSRGVLQVHQSIWRLLGLRKCADDGYLYKVYSYAMYVSSIVFFLCVYASVMYPHTTEELSLLGTSIVVSGVTLIKGCCIMQNHQLCDKLTQLMDILEHNVDVEEQQFLKRARRNSRVAFVSLGMSAMISGFLFAFYAALQPVNTLIWPSVYPFDWQHNNLIFWPVLVVQIIVTMLYEILMTSSNTYGPSMFMLLTAYFEILGLRLSRLGGQYGFKRFDHDDAKNEAELIGCIKYHHLCFRFGKILNEMFGIHYSAQFATSAMIFCGMTLMIVNFPLSIYTFNIVICVTNAAVELWLPCFFGSVLMKKSEQLRFLMYCSNWIEQPKRFKTIMMILGERTMRPIELRTYNGFFEISLPTFSGVTRFAYSLISCMKSM